MKVTKDTNAELYAALRSALYFNRESFPNGSNYVKNIQWQNWHQARTADGLRIETHSAPGVTERNRCWVTFPDGNVREVNIVKGGRGPGVDLGIHFNSSDLVTLSHFVIADEFTGYPPRLRVERQGNMATAWYGNAFVGKAPIEEGDMYELDPLWADYFFGTGHPSSEATNVARALNLLAGREVARDGGAIVRIHRSGK